MRPFPLFPPLIGALFCGLLLPVAAQEVNTSAGARWGANYFPNVPLTTHEGKEVRFFDDLIKDKVVVINFIYTTCPDACPLETARLLEVAGILGDRVGRDVFLYSISIDPEVDTPEVLAQYAKNYQTGPGWTFLTGKEEDVTRLRVKLGLYMDDIQAEDSNDHNLSLIIGNQATGRWMKRSPFENAYVLANQVGDWLHNWKSARESDRSYEDAPELREISKGEGLFRTRCSVCHTIGPGDGIFRAGPNLLGVTQKREAEWLDRWLAAPSEMLASGDPTALELFRAYNEVSMPDLKLNKLERNYLLEYIATESRRVEQTFKAEAIEPPVSEDAPSCCQKNEGPVIEDSDEPVSDGVDETTGVEGVPGESSGQPTYHGRKTLGTMSWVSIGIGCFLGFATLLMKFRGMV